MKNLYRLLFALAFTAVSAEAAAKIVSHKIKSGETLYTVAHKHHSTIEEVRKLNGIKKGEILKIGRVLKVPVNTYFPDKNKKIDKKAKKTTVAKKHTKAKKSRVAKKSIQKIKKSTKKHTVLANYSIKKGDTLYTIAKKHKMTVAELVKINKIPYKSTLKLGQKLKVSKTVSRKKSVVAHIQKKRHKTVKVAKHVIKRKKSDRILRTALKKQAKPLSAKRVRRRTAASEDIFFKSMQPSLKTFGGKLDRKKAYKITSLAKKKLGRRYVWGATGKNAFDCSGLTSYVYKKNGIRLPRRAIAQSKVGKRIPRSQLKPGDLVFFDTSKHHKGYVNHVGIYIGNGKFIHASSAKKKVVITSLNKPFYAKRFKVARRLASSS